MTLDEAIKHAEEVAEEKEKLAHTYESFKDYGNPKSSITSGHEKCLCCAEEHRQLAEWLKDYKRLLEQTQIKEGDRAVSLNAVLEKAFTLKFKDMRYMTITEKFVNVKDIKELPPITPQRSTGHWFVDERPESDRKIICSNCEQPIFKYHKLDFDYRPNYCPNCGAKMVEPQNLKYADNDTMMPAT